MNYISNVNKFLLDPSHNKLKTFYLMYDSTTNVFYNRERQCTEIIPFAATDFVIEDNKLDFNILFEPFFKPFMGDKSMLFEIDDLIDYAGNTNYHIIACVVATITSFYTFTYFETLPMLMGVLSNDKEMGFNESHKDLVNMLEYFSRIVSCLIFGFMSDIYGRWKITSYSSILCLLFGILTVVSPYTWWFILFRALQSVCTYGQFLVDLIYLQEIVVANQRILFVGYLFLTQGISYFLINIIWWTTGYNWRLFLIMTLIPYSVSCFLRIGNYESTKWLNAAGYFNKVCEITGNYVEDSLVVYYIQMTEDEYDKMVETLNRKGSILNQEKDKDNNLLINPLKDKNKYEDNEDQYDDDLDNENKFNHERDYEEAHRSVLLDMDDKLKDLYSVASISKDEIDQEIKAKLDKYMEKHQNYNIHFWSYLSPKNKFFYEILLMIVFHFGMGFSHFSIYTKILPKYLVNHSNFKVTLHEYTATHSYSSMAVPVYLNICMIITMLVDKKAAQIMNVFINVYAMVVIVNGAFYDSEYVYYQSLVTCTYSGIMYINTAMRVEFFYTNVRCISVCMLEIVVQVMASISLLLVDITFEDSQFILNISILNFTVCCLGSVLYLNSGAMKKNKKNLVDFDIPLPDDKYDHTYVFQTLNSSENENKNGN